MSLENIELDLYEAPLVATPEGEEPTPEAFADQVQDMIENTDLLTDANGVLVQYEKNDDAVAKTEAVCQCQEAIAKTGRVSKLSIESITPFISNACIKKIPTSMFTDMPTTINSKRAVEAIQDEVDQQVINLANGINETTKAALAVLAREFDKAESDHLNASGRLAQENAMFLNATKNTVLAALDDMGVSNANKDTVTGSTPVDTFNADVFAEIGSPRRSFNFFMGQAHIECILAGDKVLDLDGGMLGPDGVSPELQLLPMSFVLANLSSEQTAIKLAKVKALFQKSMNTLGGLMTNSEGQSTDTLRSLNASAADAVTVASTAVNIFASHAAVATLACEMIKNLAESVGAAVQPVAAAESIASGGKFFGMLKKL